MIMRAGLTLCAMRASPFNKSSYPFHMKPSSMKMLHCPYWHDTQLSHGVKFLGLSTMLACRRFLRYHVSAGKSDAGRRFFMERSTAMVERVLAALAALATIALFFLELWREVRKHRTRKRHSDGRRKGR